MTFSALLFLVLASSPWRTVEATAYCADRGDVVRDGSSADWTRRTVAVDPRHYSLGTVIEVCFDDGTCRRYTARDTGADIQGPGRLDILVRSCGYAREFGRQSVKVRVVRRGR